MMKRQSLKSLTATAKDLRFKADLVWERFERAREIGKAEERFICRLEERAYDAALRASEAERAVKTRKATLASIRP